MAKRCKKCFIKLGIVHCLKELEQKKDNLYWLNYKDFPSFGCTNITSSQLKFNIHQLKNHHVEHIRHLLTELSQFFNTIDFHQIE